MKKTRLTIPTKVFLTTLFAIAVVVTGIFVFGKYLAPKTPYETVEYNGFLFQKIEGLWYTQWQKDDKVYNIPLRYNPYEVELVQVQGSLNETFERSRPFFITFNPLEEDEDFRYLTLAVSELSLNLVRGLEQPVQSACTVNETMACHNRSIVDCSHADKAVIYLKAEDPTQVLLKGNCLVLQGKEMELLKTVDRALYHFYGIMR